MADTLQDLQAAAIAFRDARDWAQFHQPKDLALGLTIEAGELAELFLWKTREEARAAIYGDPAFRERLADEMADVLVFLLYLAEDSGLDLGDAVRLKLEKNGAKYPVDRSKGSAAKYTEF